MKQQTVTQTREQKTTIPPLMSGILQRQATRQVESGIAPPIVHEVLRSSGRPLDNETRAFMEPRFGHDFSRVRVHTDDKAAESARAVNARAYTVGQHVVMRQEACVPTTEAGQQLLAHELVHVVQQQGRSQLQAKLRVGSAGDVYEQEADRVTDKVVRISQPTDERWVSLRSTHPTLAQPMIQRQTPENDTKKKPPEENNAIVEGLKTVAEQVMDNNQQVKKFFEDWLERNVKRNIWNRLDTGEKAVAIGHGAATLGLFGGAMLSSPGGRKQLEGFNLATPFTLIPYMPISRFTLPSSDSLDKHVFKFETSFKADELINLRTKRRGLPEMSLGVNLQWSYDTATKRLTVLGGDASLGLVPGLSLSGGVYKDILRPSPTIIGTEGQMTQIKKSVPEFDKPQPIPDVRIMLNVDLLKFKPGDLVRQLRGIF